MTDVTRVEFYQQEDVEVMLDLNQEELSALIDYRTLLATKLMSGELVFPQFQFDGTDFCGEHIAIFQHFPVQWSGWDITCWFYRFSENLGCFPIECLERREFSKVKLVVDVETSLQLL